MPFHQSHAPVVAVISETTAPPMITNVAATNACAPISPSVPEWFQVKNEMRSNAAANTYETIGKSVNGGCDGLPAHPRTPRNRRPRIVIAGLMENSLAMVCIPPRFDGWQPHPGEYGRGQRWFVRDRMVPGRTEEEPSWTTRTSSTRSTS